MRPQLPTSSVLLLWVLAVTTPAAVAPWMSWEVLVGIDGMEVASGRFGGAVGGGGRGGWAHCCAASAQNSTQKLCLSPNQMNSQSCSGWDTATDAHSEPEGKKYACNRVKCASCGIKHPHFLSRISTPTSNIKKKTTQQVTQQMEKTPPAPPANTAANAPKAALEPHSQLHSVLQSADGGRSWRAAQDPGLWAATKPRWERGHGPSASRCTSWGWDLPTCAAELWDPYYWRAVLGTDNLWKHSRHAAKRSITHISVHPEFNRETFENDVALFKLHSAVHYSDYIQPICLPPAHPQLYPDNETKCFISGWGRIAEKGKTSSVLQEAEVEIIPSRVCNSSDAYGGLINANMICAGSPSGGVDSCQGDSGGPLACHHPMANRYYVVGITSFGLGCGHPKFPGIYVRLAPYRRWIKSQLLQHSSAATAPASTALPLTAIGMVLLYTS